MRLVRVIVLISVVLLSAVPAEAGVRFGLKGGANATTIRGAHTYGWNWNMGYTFGPSLDMQGSPHTGFQLDLLVTERGAVRSYIIENAMGQGSLRLIMLELPAVMKIKPGTAVGSRPYLAGGAVFAYLLNGKSISRSSYYEGWAPGWTESSYETNVSERGLNIGLAFGAGVEIPLKSAMFQIDARYLIGLRSFNYAGYSASDATDQTMTLAIGYYFGSQANKQA